VKRQVRLASEAEGIRGILIGKAKLVVPEPLLRVLIGGDDRIRIFVDKVDLDELLNACDVLVHSRLDGLIPAIKRRAGQEHRDILRVWSEREGRVQHGSAASRPRTPPI